MISPSDVLILMACSSSKSQAGGKVPLFDLYTGPLWQSLKTHLGDVPRRNVFVLSGQFGFQSAILFESEVYDARLGPIQTERLIARGARKPTNFDSATKRLTARGNSPIQWLGWGASRQYRAVIICASNLYRAVYEAWMKDFIAHGAVAADATIHQTQGGIGEQRAQLRQFLNLYGSQA